MRKFTLNTFFIWLLLIVPLIIYVFGWFAVVIELSLDYSLYHYINTIIKYKEMSIFILLFILFFSPVYEVGMFNCYD